MSSLTTTLTPRNAGATGASGNDHPADLNVSLPERIASIAVGAFLVARGIQKRSVLSLAGSVIGADLVYRGVTGHCQLYESMGLNTAASQKSGSQVDAESPELEQSITIAKSPDQLYEIWRDDARLARIVAHFAEVTPARDGITHWRLRGPLKQVVEWDSRYVEEQPGRKLVWQSLPGSTLVNRGEITFEAIPGGTGTEVRLHMQFEPPLGAVGTGIARALDRIPRSIAAQTLRRFRSLAETGQVPTE